MMMKTIQSIKGDWTKTCLGDNEIRHRQIKEGVP